MTRIISDNNVLAHEGLTHTLKSIHSDIEILYITDRTSALNQLESHSDIDILLLDLQISDKNDFDLLINICNTYSDTPAIVISGEDQPLIMRKVIDCGASGFIPKSSTIEVLLNAIKLVCNGGTYIPPEMFTSRPENTDINNHSIPSVITETKKAANKLTRRQTDVLELLSRGMSNRDIANTFDLSENTVKAHVASILKLFNAENRTEVVVMAHNACILNT